MCTACTETRKDEGGLKEAMGLTVFVMLVLLMAMVLDPPSGATRGIMRPLKGSTVCVSAFWGRCVCVCLCMLVCVYVCVWRGDIIRPP